jgi:glycolate oxidase iron-sulfur subunit
MAKANITAWMREYEAGGLDAVIINTSGCGTTVKDYGFMLREDRDWAEKAGRISDLAKDISEFLTEQEPPGPIIETGLKVAYHSACSMQHGQKIREEPKALLRQAGFQVLDVPEGHLCCGSAGTYNILQPGLASRLRNRKIANIERTAGLASRLRNRKIANIERTAPDLVATGNIGCITQIAGGTAVPVLHTVELLDWATGGPKPAALES